MTRLPEHIVLALREWSPRFDLNVVFREELLSLHLLVEWMRLDLVYRGQHFVMDNEVHYTVGMKVADADGADYWTILQNWRQ